MQNYDYHFNGDLKPYIFGEIRMSAKIYNFPLKDTLDADQTAKRSNNSNSSLNTVQDLDFLADDYNKYMAFGKSLVAEELSIEMFPPDYFMLVE